MAVEPMIFGKYHLVDRIATGGMAEVYRAKSYGVAGFEKTLVIKKILPNLASDKKFVEMFIDEAKIASTLSHINIVQIFDLGSQDDDYFIAMEYVDGTDLKSLVETARTTRRGVPVNFMVYIASEVAKGLDYAHRRKDAQRRDLAIVHRDISPHNVLVSHAGEVKITDFGIARATSKVNITRSGIIRGKFAYMSPEQARGESIDRRSDVFSLGIVLYEALTGTRLFKAKNDIETLKRVQTAPITPPSRINPEVTPPLEAIVFRALERDVTRRYQWASELYDDLTSYLFSSGEKVGGSELSAWVAKVLGPSEGEIDRTTDFDAFVNAIEEIGEPKSNRAPLTGVSDSASRRRRLRTSSADEPTKIEGRALERKQRTESAKAASLGGRLTPEHHAAVPRSADERTRNTQAVDAGSAGTAIGSEGRLVGRLEELREIRETLGKVAKGEGQILLLVGEDGIGKSRLLAELMQVSREMEVAFYVGRAAPELTAAPYSTVRDLLRGVVGIRGGDTEEVMRERLARLAQLGLSPAEQHFVGALFGLAYTGSSIDSFRGPERRRALTAAIEKIIQNLARERPMIMAVDNLDIADELSRGVLDHLAAGLSGFPVLVMATVSDEERAFVRGAAAAGRFHRIGLKPLSSQAVEKLACEVLEVEELAGPIAALIQSKSAGNPFRVREVIRFLLGTGALKVKKGRVLFDGAPDALYVPATTAMLAADVLAKLPEGAMRVASIAAVIGERFDASILAAAAGNEIESSLDPLAQAGIVQPEEGSLRETARTWRFTHRAFRDAAAPSLPKEESAAIRRRIAQAIADLPDLARLDHAPSQFGHYLAAGERILALEALERAAQSLLVEGAGGALLAASEQACTLLADAPPALRGRAHLRHAELLSNAGELDRARVAIDRARAAAEAADEPSMLIDVEQALGEEAVRRGRREVAAEHFERARRLAQEELERVADEGLKLRRQRELVDLELKVAIELRVAGDANRALRRCRDALELAEELRESSRVGAARDELGMIQERLGDYPAAIKMWGMAAAIWKKIGEKRALMRTYESLGSMQVDEGELEEAKNLLREALELARETGDVDGTIRLLCLLAKAHLKARQYAPAQALLVEGQTLAQRFGLSALYNLASVYLAALAAYTTDLQEGIRTLESAVARWEKDQPDKLGLLQAELLLGNAYKMARRVGPTNQHYVRALSYARDLGLDRYVREITREMKEAF